MTRRKLAFLQQGFGAVWKLQEPQTVGDMTAALADDFGEVASDYS